MIIYVNLSTCHARFGHLRDSAESRLSIRSPPTAVHVRRTTEATISHVLGVSSLRDRCLVPERDRCLVPIQKE